MECEEEFERAHLVVERFPAVDGKWVRRTRGFQSAGKYAHTLGVRMMLRRAKHIDAPAVFIFEDDVVLTPQLQMALEGIELPKDWGMFYLGGMHFERPEVVGRGLVKARGMMSTHAFGVKARYYDRLIRALVERGPHDDLTPGADVILARLHLEIPTYAVFPNLVGQREGHSDLAGGSYRPFTEDGQQIWLAECLAGVAAESLGGNAYAPAQEHASRLRAWFRFGPLPRAFNHKLEGDGDVESAPNHCAGDSGVGQRIAILFEGPEQGGAKGGVWREYLSDHEGVVACFPEDPPDAPGTRTDRTRQRLNRLRRAVEEVTCGFFLFLPSDCLPVRPLLDLICLTRIDFRSRFEWKRRSCRENGNGAAQVPASCVVQHSPWALLNREAAELVAEDDFTEHFREPFHTESWCYEATVLQLKGYPLAQKVAAQDLAKEVTATTEGAKTETIPAVEIAGLVVGGGAFFAFGDRVDELIPFGLHCRPEPERAAP